MKILALIASFLIFAQPAFAKWSQIFVIVMENAGYSAIIGNTTDAPYINKTLLPQGVLYTQSFGVAHPSLPNYLALFSGNIQENPADTSDHCVANNNGPFNAPNLYHSLIAVNKSVMGFFESLDPNDPMACGTGLPTTGGAYVQKHNPFPYFTSGGEYDVPTTAWDAYTGPVRPSWPSFAFIVPNIPNDMHVYNVSPGVLATVSQRVRNGDTWLANNLPDLISYSKSHNGLIILTMDESERSSEQHIPTILVGANVTGGKIVTQIINHYNVTKTITDNFGAPAIGQSVGLPPLTPPGTAKADFNGDGQSDILWQDTSGVRVVWLMNGTVRSSIVSLGTVDPSWNIVGSGDFNGDGKADILWQDTSGARAIWLMNGTVRSSSVSLGTVDPSWNIAGSGDFNGDGKADILWQNSSTGQRVIWLMNGTVRSSSVSLGTVPTSWSIRNY